MLENLANINAVQITESSPGTVSIVVTSSVELNQADYILRGTYIPTTSDVMWVLDPASSCLMTQYRYCADI